MTQDNDKPNFDGGGQGGVLVDRKVRAERPNLFKVLLHNDDYTPMDFVIEVLTRFFNKSQSEATEIMLAVHHSGTGLCGIYPYEIAETKVAMVVESARENEHPLQCSLERA